MHVLSSHVFTCYVLSLLKRGQNALHLAAMGGHVNTIRYLATKMESLLHSTTNLGSTMVHCAAQEGHDEMLQLVLDEYHLDPTTRDKVSVY